MTETNEEKPTVIITKPKILSIITGEEEKKNFKIDIITQKLNEFFIDFDDLESSLDFHFIYKNCEINEKYKNNLQRNIKNSIIEALKKNVKFTDLNDF